MNQLSSPSSNEAKTAFKGPDRAEKGSALSMIAAEAKATQTKTARLRALRMEREAEADKIAAEAAKAAAKAPKKTPARRVRKAAA